MNLAVSRETWESNGVVKFEAAKTAEGVHHVCIKTSAKQTIAQTESMLQTLGIQGPVLAFAPKEYAKSEHYSAIHDIKGRVEYTMWVATRKRPAEEPSVAAKRQRVCEDGVDASGVRIKLSKGILTWDAPLPPSITLPREHYQMLSDELVAIKIESVRLRALVEQKDAVLEAKQRHLDDAKEQLARARHAAQQREAKYAEHSKDLQARCNNALKLANARHAEALKVREVVANATLEIKNQQCEQLALQNQQLLALIGKK